MGVVTVPFSFSSGFSRYVTSLQREFHRFVHIFEYLLLCLTRWGNLRKGKRMRSKGICNTVQVL